MSNENQKIRVAICGGGITGATLANLLLKHQDKILFDVYESAKKFTEIGAGLGLWKRAMDVFEGAEIYEEALKIAVKPDSSDPELSMKLRIGDKKPAGFDFGEWRFEGGPLFFHRATLLDVLVANIPSHLVHFNKHLSSYTDSSSGVTLNFSDGTTATTDILIGCDGIKSVVRRQMYTDAAAESGVEGKLDEYMDKYILPTWTGTKAFRALIPAEEVEKVNPGHSALKAPMVYFGRDKHLIVFRPNETHINMVAFVSDPSKEGTQYPDPKWVRDATQDELFEAFEDFEVEGQELFRLMPKPTLWAINSLKETLPFLVKGNVVLMGDAGHAMTPHLGIGAGMSIEDAGVLTSFLTSQHITSSNYSLALEAFNTARCQKTGEILLRARDQGKVYEYRGEGIGSDTEKIEAFIEKNTGEVIRWKVGDDVEVGLKWIEEEAGKTAGGHVSTRQENGKAVSKDAPNGKVNGTRSAKSGAPFSKVAIWFSRKMGLRK